MDEYSYGSRRRRFRSNNICCVPQCFNRAGGEISLHKFPTHPMLRKQWSHLFGIGRKVPQRAVACSDHFSSDSFTRKDEQTIRRRLFHNALPSLKLPLRNLDRDKIKRRQVRAQKHREIFFTRLTSGLERSTPSDNNIKVANQQNQIEDEMVFSKKVTSGEMIAASEPLNPKEVASPSIDRTSSDLSGKEMEAALTLLGLNMSHSATSDEDEQSKNLYDYSLPTLTITVHPMAESRINGKHDNTLRNPEPCASSLTLENGTSNVPENTVGTSNNHDVCQVVVREKLAIRRRHHKKSRPISKKSHKFLDKDAITKRQERALKHLEIYARLTAEIEQAIGLENAVESSNDNQYESSQVGDDCRNLFHNAQPNFRKPVRPLDKEEIKKRQEKARKHLEYYARLTAEIEKSCTDLGRGKRHNYQSARQR